MIPVRRTLYITSKDVDDSIRDAAKAQGRSVSNYLVNLHNVNMGFIGEATVPMGNPDMPPGPIEVMAKANLRSVTEGLEVDPYIKSVSKSRVLGKVNRRLSSGCCECRSSFGHRAGCPLGGV